MWKKYEFRAALLGASMHLFGETRRLTAVTRGR